MTSGFPGQAWAVDPAAGFPLGGVDASGAPRTRMRNDTAAGYNQTDEELDADGFKQWVQHFYYAPTSVELTNWNCYHPQNMQARALTCTRNHAHDIDPHMPQPSLGQALTALERFSFIGLVEFFHESQCLLYASLRLYPDLRSTIMSRLDALRCTCHPDGRSRPGIMNADTSADLHVTHHSHHGPSKAFDSLFESKLIEQVDALTEVDRAMYAAALRTFMCQIRVLEASVGHRVLCDDTLEARQQELSYITLNISDVYHTGGLLCSGSG